MARVANHCHCYDLVPGLGAVLARPESVGDEAALHDHNVAPLVEGGGGLVLSVYWVLGVVVARTGYQGSPVDLVEGWGQ